MRALLHSLLRPMSINVIGGQWTSLEHVSYMVRSFPESGDFNIPLIFFIGTLIEVSLIWETLTSDVSPVLVPRIAFCL